MCHGLGAPLRHERDPRPEALSIDDVADPNKGVLPFVLLSFSVVGNDQRQYDATTACNGWTASGDDDGLSRLNSLHPGATFDAAQYLGVPSDKIPGAVVRMDAGFRATWFFKATA